MAGHVELELPTEAVIETVLQSTSSVHDSAFALYEKSDIAKLAVIKGLIFICLSPDFIQKTTNTWWSGG